MVFFGGGRAIEVLVGNALSIEPFADQVQVIDELAEDQDFGNNRRAMTY